MGDLLLSLNDAKAFYKMESTKFISALQGAVDKIYFGMSLDI